MQKKIVEPITSTKQRPAKAVNSEISAPKAKKVEASSDMMVMSIVKRCVKNLMKSLPGSVIENVPPG